MRRGKVKKVVACGKVSCATQNGVTLPTTEEQLVGTNGIANIDIETY